jgi:hypothetical protein
MTPSMAFESKLATTSDATPLRGKLLIVANTTNVVSAPLVLHPLNLGVRTAALASVFTKYRFKRIGFRFTGTSGATNLSSTVVLGILDDSTTGEGDAPASVASILELRSSAASLESETVPTEFTWTPVDKNLWYACQAPVTGADPRLVYPGILYAGDAIAATGRANIEIDFEIVFKGATDIGAL